MKFANQVVLITGASSGIGQCLAIDFAKRGAVVIGCGRSQERFTQTLIDVRRASPSSTMIRCDVGDRQNVQLMVTRVLADFGKIDILINNAGVGMRKSFAETDLDTVEEILRTNYLGTVYCTHAVLPSMLAQGSGHIVNISSVAGYMGILNMAGYCASKFAMNGFSESLYHELKPRGIQVTIVCPGPVRTQFNRRFADSPPQSPSALIIDLRVVSDEVFRAMEKKRFEIITPRLLGFLCRFKGIAPGLFRSLAHRAFRKSVPSRCVTGS